MIKYGVRLTTTLTLTTGIHSIEAMELQNLISPIFYFLYSPSDLHCDRGLQVHTNTIMVLQSASI